MKNFEVHPTVQWWRDRATAQSPVVTTPLNADSLRELCLHAGADDVGFVEIDRKSPIKMPIS